MMVSNLGQKWLHRLQAGVALISSALGLTLFVVAPTTAGGAMRGEQTAMSKGMSQGDRTMGADGIYLYGEVSDPNQPGKGYFIFSKSGSQVVGAIYYPQSEYSCFMGRQADARLNVNLVESGEHASNGFEVPLNPMYAIAKVGAAEAKALAACQQQAATHQPKRLTSNL